MDFCSQIVGKTFSRSSIHSRTSVFYFKFKENFDNLTTNGLSKKYVFVVMFYYCFFFLFTCSLLSATTDQVNKAKDVIKKLTIGFDSSQFENPCKISHFV